MIALPTVSTPASEGGCGQASGGRTAPVAVLIDQIAAVWPRVEVAAAADQIGVRADRRGAGVGDRVGQVREHAGVAGGRVEDVDGAAGAARGGAADDQDLADRPGVTAA